MLVGTPLRSIYTAHREDEYWVPFYYIINCSLRNLTSISFPDSEHPLTTGIQSCQSMKDLVHDMIYGLFLSAMFVCPYCFFYINSIVSTVNYKTQRSSSSFLLALSNFTT